jgi:type IV pilus assembly protein PilA
MPTLPESVLRRQEGFTLTELLVVILLVGILTAIAVPTFLGQTSKASGACAKAMSKQMYTAVKTYQTEQGSYSGASIGALNAIEPSITGGTCGPGSAVIVSNPATPGSLCPAGTSVSAANGQIGFCVGAQSNELGWFVMSENTGGVTRACSAPSGKTLPYGGCRTGGTW